jgi:hypothetical protein
MDDPHVSSGAGGVIAKLRYCLDEGGYSQQDLYLFLCPNQPTLPESSWTSQGCVLQVSVHYEWTASPGVQYTRYVPPTGSAGRHGTGWWVACAVFENPFIGSLPSNPVYISA